MESREVSGGERWGLNVMIVGATGYSGLELIRIVLQHPKLTITHLFAHSEEYQSIVEVAPHLRNILTLPIQKLTSLTMEQLKEFRRENEVVFLATPSGVSKAIGPMFLKAGFKVIDLSGDFRLKDPTVYEEWYGMSAAEKSYLEQATYGLAEIYKPKIKEATFIANPGCYATSILLALAPLYKSGLNIKNVYIDAKSGVSGAGKKLSISSHYAEVNDNFKAYKIGKHQHIPEIEQVLTEIGEKQTQVQLITHLLPMTRGILSTIYLDLDLDPNPDLDSNPNPENQVTDELIRSIYEKEYWKEPFIRLLPKGVYPETKQVYGTNYCDIGLYVDQRTNKVILFSVIDNLMKGAAGQAVQNLNIMMGWEQHLGLTFVPVYP